jgi:hypothetical protein
LECLLDGPQDIPEEEEEEKKDSEGLAGQATGVEGGNSGALPGLAPLGPSRLMQGGSSLLHPSNSSGFVAGRVPGELALARDRTAALIEALKVQ